MENEIRKKSDRVVILGTISTWKEAPFGKPGWEVWGMNQCWEWWGKYATRWFEIHPMSIILKQWDQFSWMPKCKIPIYMKKHYAMIPSSIPFPREIIRTGFQRQFSSTFCYQLALAIHEGFETIALYGVDFSKGTLRERFIEWRGVLYWLGVAVGRGIKIQFPDISGSALSHPRLYGLEYWEEVDYTRSLILWPTLKFLRAFTDGADDKWRPKKK